MCRHHRRGFIYLCSIFPTFHIIAYTKRLVFYLLKNHARQIYNVIFILVSNYCFSNILLSVMAMFTTNNSVIFAAHKVTTISALHLFKVLRDL